MQGERMPKSNNNSSNAKVQGKTGGIRTAWRDEAEEDLKIRGIKNRQAMVSDHRQLRKTELEAKLEEEEEEEEEEERGRGGRGGGGEGGEGGERG
jgi:hypothetical protein